MDGESSSLVPTTLNGAQVPFKTLSYISVSSNALLMSSYGSCVAFLLVPDLIQFCSVSPSASGIPVNHCFEESENSMEASRKSGLKITPLSLFISVKV